MLPGALVVAALAAVRKPSDPGLSGRLLGRDSIVRMALQTTMIVSSSTALAGAAAVLGLQLQRLRHPLEFDGDELATQLTSVNQLALSRRSLEEEWHALRKDPAGKVQTLDAFEGVLRVRLAVAAAEALVRDSRLRELEEVVSARLVAELESSATVLAGSAVLSRETRWAIGWQWGACGWRQCGAQADAAQALSKLHSNLGMLAPLEALYYLDVAKRAIDELLQLGVAEGLVSESRLPQSEYLPRDVLDRILEADDEDAGYDGSHKVLGTKLRAEKQFDLEERVLLEQEEMDAEGSGDSDEAEQGEVEDQG